MNILVYIELTDGVVCENSIDLISYAKFILQNAKTDNEIAENKGQSTVCGVVILPFEFSNKIEFLFLKKYGLDKLYVIKSRAPFFDKRNYGRLVVELLKKASFDIFILNSTTEGREIAPVAASSLDTGLTADCTKLEIINNKLYSTRPTYGGKLMASILCKKNPQMATVRVNTFKKTEVESHELELEIQELEFPMPAPKTEIIDFVKDKRSFCNLTNAKIVLAGGMGLKNKENFNKLKLLADLMGAKTGGTRKAVDKGFIEKEFQIGQTGACVTPEIYIAFGISGAIHHIMGMENSKKIIAINTDKNAPIFNYADIGIIEDGQYVIEKLINLYKN